VASSGEITGEVNVTFQQFGNSKVQANFLNVWAKTFTAAHPQATVKLQPIVASENDYYTKLQLSMRSPRTAPDMCYEDTFLINSDISAGYLTPLDDRLNGWPDWSQFNEELRVRPRRSTARRTAFPMAPTSGRSGSTRSCSLRRGCQKPGSRRSWNDIMTAAQTIKSKVLDYDGSGVVPHQLI
jgi:multiple sugar transport system substrate-binding protein